MDWPLAIERNRKPLLRIVATLFAMIGLAQGGAVERLPWPLYRAVLRVLRPAEAAVRRLIVAAARDMVVKPRATRQAPAGRKIPRKAKGQGRKSFQLFDPRQRSDRDNGRHTPAPRTGPHVCVLEFDLPISPLYRRPPAAPAPKPKRVPEDTVNAGPLCRRLAAIKAALEDLQRQARRYARWRARPLEQRRPKRASTLRPGPPPGHRKRLTHKVHEILSECDWLAYAVPQPDTS